MMKKLITILFLFTFTVNAQFQLEEDWRFTTGNKLHAGAGVAVTALVFIKVYKKAQLDDFYPNDEEWARHNAIFWGIVSGFGKEFLDGMMDKEIQLSDFAYTAAFSIATGWACYGIAKWRKKRIQKKNRKLFALRRMSPSSIVESRVYYGIIRLNKKKIQKYNEKSLELDETWSLDNEFINKR